MYDNSRIRREIGQYLEGMRQQGMSKKHVQGTRYVLLEFSRHCAKEDIGSSRGVSMGIVMDFLKRYERFSAGYQIKARSYLRKFLAEHDNPAMLKIRSKVTGSSRTRVDWLTPEETVLILHSPMSPAQSVLIGAGLLQGMRRVETLRLSVKDARNAIRFSVLRVRGKGGKEREIPMDRDFSEVLTNYLRQSEDQEEGSALLGFQDSKSERLLKDFCTRFGRKFTFHTMRRTFGRNLWLLGTPIETISELLGHSSSDMTRRYLGLNLTDMRQALARYSVSRDCTTTRILD
jgi:integrase